MLQTDDSTLAGIAADDPMGQRMPFVAPVIFPVSIQVHAGIFVGVEFGDKFFADKTSPSLDPEPVFRQSKMIGNIFGCGTQSPSVKTK